MFTDPRNSDRDQFEDRFKESLDNTFLIFTGQRTYNEIMCDSTKPHFFFFDPEIFPTKDDVVDLIYFYEEYEDYKKCGELFNLINKFK